MTSTSTGKCFGPGARPFWALAAVVLVEIALFAGHHAERWDKSLLPRHDPRLDAGEGLVIRCDGHGYYAWLRSLLVDGDWSFDNEFDDHNPLGDWVPTARTETGLRSNPWSVGPACVWSLTVVPTHLVLTGLHDGTFPWQPNGYDLPYQLAVGITTVLASVLGLVFLYGICRCYARPSRAALAAAFLTLGTTIVYYSAVEVAMAHGLATVALAGLVYYWLKTYGSDRPWRWFLVGFLVGVAALMRWQLATFALLPAGECFLNCRRIGRAGAGACRKSFALLVLAGLGAGLGFLPQAIAWKAVFGHWIVATMATSHNWLNPSCWQVLGSMDRGLFYWTPLTLLALARFFVYRGRPAPVSTSPSISGRREPLALLLAAFVLQIYVVASLLGAEMTLGVSFGLRFFTESMVALAPGLAILLERSPPRWFRLVAALGCLLVLWNLLLIAQYRYGLIPAAGGADPGTMLSNAARQLVLRKKFLLVGQVFAGPIFLWLLLGWGPVYNGTQLKTALPSTKR